MSIKFGTDGWRAVISDTFTFNNLRLVAQAIADYVRNEGDNGRDPEVVIGFDTRFLSDRYAAEVARVMAGNGIVAWLTRADAPTPAISYSVVDKKAAAGHHDHGQPQPAPLQRRQAQGGLRRRGLAPAGPAGGALSGRGRSPGPGPNIMDYQRALDQGLIRRFDPVWAYYEHLGNLVDLDVISSGELRVVADAMYGSGRGCIWRDAGPHPLPGPRDPGRDEPRLWRHPPRTDWPAT